MKLSLLELLALASTMVFAVSVAWVVIRPYRSLAGRVRPYSTVARVRLTRSADVRGVAHDSPAFGDATLRRLFGPIFDRLVASFGRLVATSNTARLTLRLRQAGLYPDLPEAERVQEFRVRSLARSLGWAAGFGALGLVTSGPLSMVLFAGLGFVYGVLNARARIDKAVTERSERMRGELYTINQLIAMRTRVGGGVIDAIRHVVIRGNGILVDELAEVLRLHESGIPLTVALNRASDLTPEPEAARTYGVLATAQDRGADLGEALLDLSKDLRSARREELQRDASKKRLLMVIPIVVILAPIVLLFIAGPIPQIIFGGI
ncbi:MAG: type II secretion system F family protein [Acidimicrobiia bacterium]|nr:type II secretion system F family protein [Acidimicrobiia bacterium]MDX2468421.1 type II secretion system F family protein [Acidimicrobiia bacterium]